MKTNMGTMLIDKLLWACVKQGASELYVRAGQPPLLRVQGQLQGLESKALTPADTHLLMECITPYRHQQEFHHAGNTEFEFGFGEASRFRVSVMRARGVVDMLLRQISMNELNSHEQG